MAPGENPGLRGERAVTNRLKHETAFYVVTDISDEGVFTMKKEVVCSSETMFTT
jgi:hypothetical protein